MLGIERAADIRWFTRSPNQILNFPLSDAMSAKFFASLRCLETRVYIKTACANVYEQLLILATKPKVKENWWILFRKVRV